MNTTKTELGHEGANLLSPNTGSSESADTNGSTITEQAAPQVSKDDFKQEQVKPSWPSEAEKQQAREARAEAAAESVYTKFVDVTDDWDLDFSKVPKEFAWAKNKILEKYSNPMVEEPTNQAPIDVNSAIENKFLEKEFDSAVTRILSNDDLTDEQKADIKSEYLSMSRWTMSVQALEKAHELVTLRSWARKVIGGMPNIGKPSVDWSKKSTITNEQLSQLSQSEYNAASDKIEKWLMAVV